MEGEFYFYLGCILVFIGFTGFLTGTALLIKQKKILREKFRQIGKQEGNS